jgi:hypothetical protein
LHVLLIAAVACAGLARVANAMCIAPKPAVLWSYPSAGADDVPTDAVFWFVVTSHAPRVELNGETLQVSSESSPVFDAVAVDPGPLAPDSDFVLRLEFDAAPKLEIPFHTASADKSAPAEPTVRGDHETPGLSPTHACADVISAQGCFDTGQDATIELDIAPGTDAIAWLVHTDVGENTLWPATCGMPALVVHSTFGIGCADIQAVGKGGALSETTRYCMEGGENVPTLGTSGGAGSTGAASNAGAGSDVEVNKGCSVIAVRSNRERARSYALCVLPLLALRARRRLLDDRKWTRV